MSKPVYAVEYWKDDEGFWLVHIPNLDGGQLTQARDRFEVPLMAQDLIMTILECGPHEFRMVDKLHRREPDWVMETEDPAWIHGAGEPPVIPCQVVAPSLAKLECDELDSDGMRCEMKGEHQTHWVSDHTAAHAIAGDGYTCANI